MNKKNYNNILVYLEEITMFSLHINSLKFQELIHEDILDNSKTLKRIERLEKSWDNINLNLDLNFNERVRQNFINEIDSCLNEISKDLITVNNHNYDNKEEILEVLSDSTNNLNTLKSRLLMMIVE